MNVPIEIRPVAANEFDLVQQFYEKSVRLNSEGFIQDLDQHLDLHTATDMWRSSGGELLTAWIGSRLSAMGGLAPHGDGTAEFCMLHVAADLQGRGIGRRIAGEVLDLADRSGFETVTLHVTTSQQAAIGLYRSLGFRTTMQQMCVIDVFGSPASFDTLFMDYPLNVDLGTESELV